jgi:hypothetical protein
VHSVIADSAGGAWSFGGSILTFVFPMILFVVVACALYVAYTKPELVPGHRNPAAQRAVTYTAVVGPPPAGGPGQVNTVQGGAETATKPEGGE